MNNTIWLTLLYFIIVGVSLIFAGAVFVIVVHYALKIIKEYKKSRKE